MTLSTTSRPAPAMRQNRKKSAPPHILRQTVNPISTGSAISRKQKASLQSRKTKVTLPTPGWETEGKQK